jgi:hypothetical protein
MRHSHISEEVIAVLLKQAHAHEGHRSVLEGERTRCNGPYRSKPHPVSTQRRHGVFDKPRKQISGTSRWWQTRRPTASC